MIEHNLDVIKTADRLIDMGPEGGEEGGRLMAAGTPEEVAAVEESYTGAFLRGAREAQGGEGRPRAAPPQGRRARAPQGPRGARERGVARAARRAARRPARRRAGAPRGATCAADVPRRGCSRSGSVVGARAAGADRRSWFLEHRTSRTAT